MIVTTDVIVNISSFEVLPFCNLLSDKHNPIDFTINLVSSFTCNNNSDVTQSFDNKCTTDVVKWKMIKRRVCTRYCYGCCGCY